MLSGPLGIGLIVLLWLCVLTPLILRNQKPISRTNEGFDQTRVVLKGNDENEGTRRRRPRFFMADEELLLDDEEPALTDELDPLIGEDEDYDAPRKKEVRNAASRTQSPAVPADESAATADTSAQRESEDELAPHAITVKEEDSVLPALGENEEISMDLGEHTEDADAEAEAEILAEAEVEAESDIEAKADAAEEREAEIIAADSLDEALADEAEAVVADAESTVTATIPVDEADLAEALAELQEEELEDEAEDEAEGEIVAEDTTESSAEDSEAVSLSAGEEAVEDKSQPQVPVDESALSPADLLHPGATYEQLPQPEPEPEVEVSDSEELTAEEIAFAEKRRGRGGYDPKADAANRVTRYQRRKRTLVGLGIALLITLVAAIILGSGVWAAPIVVAVITVLYLWALRQNVKAEAELRARRIKQMRRARLGVRSNQDEKLGIPDRLRRPGAIVVEASDESPDFDLLPLTNAELAVEEPDVVELDRELRVS